MWPVPGGLAAKIRVLRFLSMAWASGLRLWAKWELQQLRIDVDASPSVAMTGGVVAGVCSANRGKAVGLVEGDRGPGVGRGRCDRIVAMVLARGSLVEREPTRWASRAVTWRETHVGHALCDAGMRRRPEGRQCASSTAGIASVRSDYGMRQRSERQAHTNKYT